MGLFGKKCPNDVYISKKMLKMFIEFNNGVSALLNVLEKLVCVAGFTVECLGEKDIANSYKETDINSQKFRREKTSTEILSPPKIFLAENVYLCKFIKTLYFDLSHLKISINLMFLYFAIWLKIIRVVELTQLLKVGKKYRGQLFCVRTLLQYTLTPKNFSQYYSTKILRISPKF